MLGFFDAVLTPQIERERGIGDGAELDLRGVKLRGLRSDDEIRRGDDGPAAAGDMPADADDDRLRNALHCEENGIGFVEFA